MSRSAWIAAWAAATLLVLAATVWPPSAYAAHPHWDRVSWLPLADPWSNRWELAANVLLFLPFGYAGSRVLGTTRTRVLGVVGLAALLSLGVECAQLFAHGRFPSATDLTANVAGAALAAALARRERG